MKKRLAMDIVLFLTGWLMLWNKYAASVANGTFVYPTFLGILAESKESYPG